MIQYVLATSLDNVTSGNYIIESNHKTKTGPIEICFRLASEVNFNDFEHIDGPSMNDSNPSYDMKS